MGLQKADIGLQTVQGLRRACQPRVGVECNTRYCGWTAYLRLLVLPLVFPLQEMCMCCSEGEHFICLREADEVMCCMLALSHCLASQLPMP